MDRDPNVLVEKILSLVSELAEMANARNQRGIGTSHAVKDAGKGKKDNSGATGGIRLLLSEGYFDELRK